ncbi:MAG TPA: hypothetical protein VGF47_01975 [Solirubrobacteraceae bacterium]
MPADARVAPDSASAVAALAAEVAAGSASGTGPWVTIDTTSYSVPVYTVPRTQPTVVVALENPRQPALAKAFRAVPLPSTAQPAVGTDGELVVWQPSTDRMWEFWRLSNLGGAWSAQWGGAMRDVSRNSGVYGRSVWPGAAPWWGATASSLPLVGGLVTLEDLRAGKIEHALAISVPNVRAGLFMFPAHRTDGTSSSPLSLSEGAHLRLDPTLDLRALHLPRLSLMLAEAAQRYGVYVRDRSPNVGFYGQDPTPTGVNPYAGPTGYLEGRTPKEVLTSFPLASLQLLSAGHHVTAGRGAAPRR